VLNVVLLLMCLYGNLFLFTACGRPNVVSETDDPGNFSENAWDNYQVKHTIPLYTNIFVWNDNCI